MKVCRAQLSCFAVRFFSVLFNVDQRSGHLNFAKVSGEIGQMAPKSWKITAKSWSKIMHFYGHQQSL